MERKWDRVVDVIIVGLGGAGGAAAIEAHDNGAKVLVLEKDKIAGGNTRLSGGTLRRFLDEDKVVQYYMGVVDETVSEKPSGLRKNAAPGRKSQTIFGPGGNITFVDSINSAPHFSSNHLWLERVTCTNLRTSFSLTVSSTTPM